MSGGKVDKRTLTWIYGGGRVAIGVAAMSIPALASRSVSGRDAAGIEPLFARMLGARDVALGLGTILALRQGAPLRGWFEVSILVDFTDAAFAIVEREQMKSPVSTVVVAAGSAVAGAVLSRRFSE